MKYFAILFTSALLLVAATAQPAIAAAADNYKAKCGMCHGADGSGNTAMGKKLELRDLRSEATQGHTDAQLMEIIENGKGKMPGQKGKLSKDDIKQLVSYIRDLAKKK